ncbi:hypothetical protein HK096_010506, partial [Nowakowskiella sp. JEL0078]
MKLLLVTIVSFAVSCLAAIPDKQSPICNILNYGAQTNNPDSDVAVAILNAFNKCVKTKKKSTLLIPKFGVFYLNTPIVLEGHCDWKLHWLGTINLKFMFNDTSYLPLKNFGATQGESSVFVLKDISHFELDGGKVGVFDGHGESWWNLGGSSYRPVLLKTVMVQHSIIHGLTLKNSPFWSMAAGGRYVDIYDMLISSPSNAGGSKNVDGIDPVNATHIYIHDSIINSGDDCIAVKNNVSFIEVANVICNHSHGLSIGSVGIRGSFANISHVLIRDSIMYGNETTNGARVKTWDGGSGSVSYIRFDNITLHDVYNPIIVDAKYW